MPEKIHVLIKSAVSLDGKLSTIDGESSLSDKEDFKLHHKYRAKYDAILIGGKTAVKDNPKLNVRYVEAKNPVRIILDGEGDLVLGLNIFDKSVKTIIYTTENGVLNYDTKILKTQDVRILGKDSINIVNLLCDLEKENITSLMVEGGGSVNWSFICSGCVDEIILSFCPVIFGGKNAVSFAGGAGFEKVKKALHLNLIKTEILKSGIIIAYYQVKEK